MNSINISWTTYGREGLVEGTEERVRAIEGFDGYFITDHGRVFSCKHRVGFGEYGVDYDRPFELKSVWYKGENRTIIPYKKVRFNGNISKTVHRLVAESFIANPHNLPQVNHLTHHHNNHFAHLEWCTQLENNRYKAHKHAKEHILYDPKGNRIVIKDLMAFCKENNLHQPALYNRGKTKGWIYKGRVEQQAQVEATLDRFFV